jgi:hypothetical protein
MAPKKIGMRKGTRNKDFFFRSGRGWCTKQDSHFVPLLDEHGVRLRHKDTSDNAIREAYARILVGPVEPRREAVRGKDAPVDEVCAMYLDYLRAQAGEFTNPQSSRR